MDITEYQKHNRIVVASRPSVLLAAGASLALVVGLEALLFIEGHASINPKWTTIQIAEWYLILLVVGFAMAVVGFTYSVAATCTSVAQVSRDEPFVFRLRSLVWDMWSIKFELISLSFLAFLAWLITKILGGRGIGAKVMATVADVSGFSAFLFAIAELTLSADNGKHCSAKRALAEGVSIWMDRAIRASALLWVVAPIIGAFVAGPFAALALPFLGRVVTLCVSVWIWLTIAIAIVAADAFHNVVAYRAWHD